MSKIRNKSETPKIKKTSADKSQGCSSDQYPWLSFRFMTRNKDHYIGFLDSLDKNEREITLKSLYDRFEEITQSTWTYWHQMNKKVGFETISYNQLKFSPNTALTRDTTIFVFRFDTYRGNKKGRIIGFKNSPCAAFQIIGYDFDFSGYDH